MNARMFHAPFRILPVSGGLPRREAVFACAGKVGADWRVPALPTPLRKAFDRAVARGFFKGESGEVHVLDLGGATPPRTLVLAGLGDDKALSPDRLRCAIAAAVRSSRPQKVASAWAVWPKGIAQEAAVRAAAEGAVLGSYEYDLYKGKKAPPLALRRLELAGDASGAARRAAETGRILAEAQCFARDLANAPANDCTPSAVAAVAAAWARKKGLRFRVLDEKRMARLGFGALLGVGRGSRTPPRLVVLEYTPRRARGAATRPIAFVGKGITFDTGGISIKPASNMHHMKGDMGGAAAVIAALGAVADLRLPHSVVGLAPLAENMPGGNAQRPGDIVRSLSGLTIEVLNTDAEGRLILADALAYAARYKPAVTIDIATLTGACASALGNYAAGFFSDDANLVVRMRRASERSGEKIWPMPLWEEYRKSMDSDVADLKNISEQPVAGATTAAIFLARFAAHSRWGHVDMAGPMWANAETPLTRKGTTGYGARLLAQFAMDW